MNKGGIIIRLIDVAMIILFGFIAISDIKVRAQIKLPSDEQKEPPVNEPDPALVFVKIDMQNGFLVEQNEEVVANTMTPDELEQILTKMHAGYQRDGEKMVVLIEPDEDSMIQHTVDVLDICERNRIPKNINYESLQF